MSPMALHRHLPSPPQATCSSSSSISGSESYHDGSAGNANAAASASTSPSNSTLAPMSTARPAFTTSLSDFALPPRSSSPAPFARRNTAATANAGPQAGQARYSAGGGYHLRPRSNLSRSVIVAGQEDEEGQENEGDDEDSGREGPARRINSALQASVSDVFSMPPPKSGDSSHHANTHQSTDGHQSMVPEEEDDSETSASLRAFRASTSPQIARTINAGYAARMGSLPALSPKALKRASDSRPKHRTRRDGSSTSPISRNFVDDGGHEQIGDLDLDVDVELDLDGMDMKMTDTDRGSPGPSSPTVAMTPSLLSPTHKQSSRFSHHRTSIRPSTFESIDEEARQADREDNGQNTVGGSTADLMDSQSTGLTSVQRFSPSSRSTSPTHSRRSTSLAGPLPPSLKRVLYSMRDESEPSQLEIASEAKVTKKLSSAQQAAEVEARRLDVVARRTSSIVDEQAAWLSSHIDGAMSSADDARPSTSRATSPCLPWLRATGSSVASSVGETRNRSMAFSGGVASDFSEEHLLDDVGFESDELTSSDDSEFLSTTGSGAVANQAPSHNADDDMRTSDDEMVAVVKISPERGHSQAQPTPRQLGLGIGDTGSASGDLAIPFSPPMSGWQSRPNGDGFQMIQADGATADYPSNAAVHSSSLSTTPTQPPPAHSLGQSSSVHHSKKRSSSAAWTNFRNSPSATSSHHHHHTLRGSPNASLDKRHLHRLQHGPYHRGGGHGSGSSRLSTSPGAAAARGMSGYKSGGGAVGGPLQSPQLIASGGGSQKRKFGASTPTMEGGTSLSPGTRGLSEYSHRSSIGGSSPPSGSGILKRRRAGSPLSGVSTGGGYFALQTTANSSSTTPSACPSPLLFSTAGLSPPTATTTASVMGHGG